MPSVVGIDHLVLSVGNFARSKEFYSKLLRFLGFKLKYDYADMAGWSNGRTLFWIAAADTQGRRRKYRKGDIGFHHYAFELASRKDVDELGAFLEKNEMTVLDPPGEYYGRNYYAVYFADPDGMKLEGMIWTPPGRKRKPATRKKARTRKSPTLPSPARGGGIISFPSPARGGGVFDFSSPACGGGQGGGQDAMLSSARACATTMLRPRRLAV